MLRTMNAECKRKVTSLKCSEKPQLVGYQGSLAGLLFLQLLVKQLPEEATFSQHPLKALLTSKALPVNYLGPKATSLPQKQVLVFQKLFQTGPRETMIGNFKNRPHVMTFTLLAETLKMKDGKQKLILIFSWHLQLTPDIIRFSQY